MKNSKSTSSNTGYKGIYFRAETGKYEAQIITARRQVRNDNKFISRILWMERIRKIDKY